MANSELALAIALPVGIVCLLAAFIAIAWMAGRRRRIRTDPIEAAKGTHPSDLQRQLYGVEEAGSVATTLNSSSAGSGSGLGRSKSLFSKRYSAASSTGGSFRESDLWDLQRDEVLDDREWVPLEAGWREQYRGQQQQHQHHSSRRSSHHSGRRGSRGSNNNGWNQTQPPYGMPAMSSRMSGGMSMALSQADAAGPYPTGSFRPRGSVGSGFSSVSSNGSRGGPPPSTSNNMSMSRGSGSNGHHGNIHGGASSSTLRSLGTVPEVPPFKAGRPLGEATTEAEAEAVYGNGKSEAPTVTSTSSPSGTMTMTTTTTTMTFPIEEAQVVAADTEAPKLQAKAGSEGLMHGDKQEEEEDRHGKDSEEQQQQQPAVSTTAVPATTSSPEVAVASAS